MKEFKLKFKVKGFKFKFLNSFAIYQCLRLSRQNKILKNSFLIQIFSKGVETKYI